MGVPAKKRKRNCRLFCSFFARDVMNGENRPNVPALSASEISAHFSCR